MSVESLVACLQKDPADLRSWHVYCDWLLERVDMAVELQRELDAACAVHEARWREVWGLPPETGLTWRCGFLVGARLLWGEAASRLLSHPVARYLRELHILGLPPHLVQDLLDQLPEGQLQALGLQGLRQEQLGSRSAQRLAACDKLRSLTALSLHDHNLDDRSVVALVESEHLRALRALSLAGNYVEDAGAMMLAEPESFTRLQRLDLAYNNVESVGASALAEREGLLQLALGRNPIGLRGILALAHSEALRSLETLDLRGTHLDERALQALLASTTLREGALQR